ncbi:murein transglycosylase [Micromonospora sicca]|uniref:Murein transglycosylase n=1 Tax=Micromonospora sicca TaxID=2202420 RepID=A0A317DKK2_9ACTN|nr:lytic murein transglycosylase [Micromonospora sp. 4G51]PWR15309.1 murein transglycosylase [Micromonospora sp. 4G51]
MVDGEDTSRVRPLRPAAPPDDPGTATESTPVPRPRRPWLRSTQPAPAGAPPEPAGAPKPAEGEARAADAPPVDRTPTAGEVEPTAGDANADKPEADKPEADGPKADEPKADEPKADEPDAGQAAAASKRRRVPFAHAVRVPPPRQLAVGAARATRAWSRRPSGRATLPGVFLLVLVGATAAAGALLVPQATRTSRPVAVDATASVSATGVPEGGALPGPTGTAVLPGLPGATGLPGTPLPTGTLPGGGRPTGPVVGPASTGRPADALAAWAQQMSARTEIPAVAMQAYGYAELVLAETHRSCQLSWTTLAAIGYVESRHGSANSATLGSTGRAEPEIVGDPLDGQGGRSRILDTDRGQLDHDTVYDRALGPMQFIPSTWQEIGADADNDGRRDPHDIDDAALAAGNYLCKGGRNMTIPGDWWGAILSYNDVRRYAQSVFDRANEYGRLSRT